MKRIDLSVDLGEATTDEERAIEDEIWPLITSVNVACGGHVGDADSMRRSVARAVEYGVQLGAHPSYPDREHFGRRSMAIEPARLRESLAEQLETLRRIARTEGAVLRHVKAHGALYNDAHRNAALATVIADAVVDVDCDLELVASSTSQLAVVCSNRGLTFVAEAFADRRYTASGELVPRGSEGALLLDVDVAAGQALGLAARGEVTTLAGTPLHIAFRTLCLHGDMPNAPARVRRVRDLLTRSVSVSSDGRRD